MTLHIYAPAPRQSLKRKLDCLEDENSLSSPKRLRSDHKVLDWLQDSGILARSQSASPSISLGRDRRSRRDMSQGAPAPQTAGRQPTLALTVTPSMISGRMKTDDPNYPQTLYKNNVIKDRSGRRMSSKIRTFVESTIKKERTSPPLRQDELDRVVNVAEQIADSCEGAVYELLSTAMFPLIEQGISYGGNAQFSSQPLPNVPDAFCELAIPQPDRFYGYTTGPFGGFSKKENMVLSHPSMIRYAMPTADGAFPFLIFELRSPAKGGTLWHADNQAAGSGAHCVSSMRYLMQQANGEDAALPSTKALAFTVCVDGRYVEFNIHWYSEEAEEYMMSCIDSFRTVQEKDIQECRNRVKNIIEYCLNQRRTEIVNALETLHPFPPTWSNKKPRTRGGSSTPATSFTTTSSNR